ncbi:hypothetical protein OEZ85_014093 [Tetradesmus obliquus]|uniref:Uncharacterized protein n=1 Tax=Tetradesmus obliquus TaxID=3088 RepID=A0ABY8U975_TETOB|nr:hypothetical protein OEZ85_014093 [Tetradesmus obliquus]
MATSEAPAASPTSPKQIARLERTPGVQFSVLQQLPDANLAVTVTDLLLDEEVVIELRRPPNTTTSSTGPTASSE